MDRSLLTQAEAAFLLSPAARTGGDCIRAALLSLIAQGRIAIAEKAGPTGTLELILGSDNGPAGLAPHQRAVEMALRQYRDGKRLKPTEVIAALQKQFGSGYGCFVHDHIAPELIALGYAVKIETKWLGFIPRSRYGLTAKGHEVAVRLRRELASLDDLPALVAANPAFALQLAHSAGVMLMLSPIARKQIPRLRRLMAQREGDPGLAMTPAPDQPASIAGVESHVWPADRDGCGLLDGVGGVCEVTAGDSGSGDGGDGGGDGGGD